MDSRWLEEVVPYAEEISIGAIGTNMIEENIRAFASGYVVTDKHRAIPVRRAYIAIGCAQVNRCLVGAMLTW